MHDIEVPRDLVRQGDNETLELIYENIPDVLSQLIRTALISSEGNRLIVADFSAIEARVIAWLSGEKWRLNVFNTHGKIYEASASAMFHVPIEEITKDNPLRQKGKIAELALGYGGSVGALEQMGALKMGLTKDELQPLVSMWRSANRRICAYWNEVQDAAIEAVKGSLKHGIGFRVAKGVLFCKLPSGRELAYYRPEIRPGKFGGDALCYQGLDQTTKQWKRIDTFGGKLVENIVQAIARDLLAYAMLNLDKKGYSIVGHVHDEIIIDAPKHFGSLDEVIEIMTTGPVWAKGLPLAADGFESEFYKK
jgi:DNA polymerase